MEHGFKYILGQLLGISRVSKITDIKIIVEKSTVFSFLNTFEYKYFFSNNDFVFVAYVTYRR